MTNELAEPLLAERDSERPSTPTMAELQQQVKAAVALGAIAQSLDCLTESDLCTLAGITPGTAAAWRKRGTGPAYSLVGNRVLYPRAKVSEFIERQLRERAAMPGGSFL